MKIGFNVSDDQESEEAEVGFADSAPHAPPWYSELPEAIADSLIKFWLIYGLYASCRDLVLSIF